MTISAPGFYPTITPDEYFAEPCPEPALSNTLIGILTNKSPAHARYAHPALTPDPDVRKSSAAQYRGSLVHRLALGKGQDFLLSPYDEFRTNEAKAWRDGCVERGQIPVKQKDYDAARAMADIVQSAIDVATEGQGYETEVVIAWQETTSEGAIWCRAMLDVWCPDLNLALDVKTCADASDVAIDKAFARGYGRQGTWYPRGIDKILGEPGRAKFQFLFVESEAPFVGRTADNSEAMRYGSSLECDRAAALFAKCLESGEWPEYGHRSVQPTPWQVRDWEDAELEER